MHDILEILKPLCVGQIVPVGSRVTCNPPPMDTDADYLCFVKSDKKASFLMEMYGAGFVDGGSEVRPGDHNILNEDGDEFVSFKLDDINIIATTSPEFMHKFLAASSIAKRLNLLNKKDRIALFQAVLYGTIDNLANEMTEFSWL